MAVTCYGGVEQRSTSHGFVIRAVAARLSVQVQKWGPVFERWRCRAIAIASIMRQRLVLNIWVRFSRFPMEPQSMICQSVESLSHFAGHGQVADEQSHTSTPRRACQKTNDLDRETPRCVD